MVQQNSNPWEEDSDTDSIIRSEELTKEQIKKRIKKNESLTHLLKRTY